ncbi:unnamed protein product [Paramecium pentaurelia]|uniref:Uncharacterized protein n=1 Tax=Paramecium pentaurelia TaxID=43138 RepID=A0A8S1WMP1_9CILI|nr:unnamed protein product [Paramecium pentaurelia]
MSTTFEEILYEDNFSYKLQYVDTDSFLLQTENYEPQIESDGMLIEAELDEGINFQIDQPQNVNQPAFQKILKTPSKQIQNKKYRFPRESKNYFKNIGPKLKEFIIENFSHIPQIMNQPLIQEYLQIKNQRHIKLHIQKLCQIREGLTIAKSFFKNYRWSKSLVNDDLSSYFRLNSDWNN